MDVFRIAKKIQDRLDHKTDVALVVLDEVGLAEDSPSFPLKVLHPLLEDGTDGSEHMEQVSVCFGMHYSIEESHATLVLYNLYSRANDCLNCSAHSPVSYCPPLKCLVVSVGFRVEIIRQP